ncbi:hypothetical protein, partial [Streptomyces albospinus]|uniref:hypothetical protein n=1 Tax=Streptomyces albospinus TaxID=285515 RepID=UPI001E2AA288
MTVITEATNGAFNTSNRDNGRAHGGRCGTPLRGDANAHRRRDCSAAVAAPVVRVGLRPVPRTGSALGGVSGEAFDAAEEGGVV